MANRVKVRIYGQEYVIMGDKETEEIEKIAAYADEKIREVAKFIAPGMQGMAPTLALVNVAEEYFGEKDEVEALKAKNAELEIDLQNYLKMWEDAKKSFAQYKDGVNQNSVEKEELEKTIAELAAKCKEFEDAFFEVQMENMKLKGELDKIKRDNF